MHILSVSVILASDSIFVFNKYRLTSTPFYGFLAPHHSYMKYYITSHVPAFSIEISQKTDGNKSWHQHYNNPTTGLGYLYANFGNKILGNTHGLYSFMNVPIIHRLKFNFNVQIASGLAYITQKFDADDNYLNTAIASRLNYYFNLSFDTKINLSRPSFILILKSIGIKEATMVTLMIGNKSCLKYNEGLIAIIFLSKIRLIPNMTKIEETI